MARAPDLAKIDPDRPAPGTPELHLSLEEGGSARLLTLDGDHVHVASSRPYPPGSTLVGTDEGTGAEYRLKVRGCRRAREGRFVVQGRLVNLAREQRATLLGS